MVDTVKVLQLTYTEQRPECYSPPTVDKTTPIKGLPDSKHQECCTEEVQARARHAGGPQKHTYLCALATQLLNLTSKSYSPIPL